MKSIVYLLFDLIQSFSLPRVCFCMSTTFNLLSEPTWFHRSCSYIYFVIFVNDTNNSKTAIYQRHVVWNITYNRWRISCSQIHVPIMYICVTLRPIREHQSQCYMYNNSCTIIKKFNEVVYKSSLSDVPHFVHPTDQLTSG